MEKIKEISDDELERHHQELMDFKKFAGKQARENHIAFVHDFEWNNFCEGLLSYFRNNGPREEKPEELHFTPLNRLVQKIPSKNWNDTVNNCAKKLRDCLIKEGYLKDASVLQDYISYMNGNNVPIATKDEQEQPEVDLEKEILETEKKYGDINEMGGYQILLFDDEFRDILRYYYKLGKNARKEEKV